MGVTEALYELDSVEISVLDPVLIDPVSDKIICIGQIASVKAHARVGKGTFKYTWIPAPDFISASGDSVSLTPKLLNPIIYFLKVENDYSKVIRLVFIFGHNGYEKGVEGKEEL